MDRVIASHGFPCKSPVQDIRAIVEDNDRTLDTVRVENNLGSGKVCGVLRFASTTQCGVTDKILLSIVLQRLRACDNNAPAMVKAIANVRAAIEHISSLDKIVVNVDGGL